MRGADVYEQHLGRQFDAGLVVGTHVVLVS